MSQANGSLVKVAMHVHTLYSPCAETKLEQIGPYCKSKGVDVICVTDHDTIAGALALKAMTRDVRVVVGEEISCSQGEIIGLFLKEEVPPKLDAVETCQRIKDQGGLVYIPHPFDFFKIHRLAGEAILKVLDYIDMIEVYNSKSLLPSASSIARRFVVKHNKISAVGSDAHYLPAIDLCLNEIRNFKTPEEFLENMRDARLMTHRVNSLRTWWVGIKNALKTEGHSIKHKYRKL